MAKRKNRYKKLSGSKDNTHGETRQFAKNNIISQEQMVEIYAEAYYGALKRVEKEKIEIGNESLKKKEYTWLEKVLFMGNVIIFPWKIHKRFSINNRIHDSILVLFVSIIFAILGFIMWVSGLIGIGSVLFKLYTKGFNGEFISDSVKAVVVSLFGSIFILAGREFEKETDSVKIYAYFSCVMAFISCVVAIIALIISTS